MSARRSSTSAWTVSVALLLALAPQARANGRFPTAGQIAFRPHGDAVALRTTFGVLLSRDRGSTWDWICEGAIAGGGAEEPFLAFTGGGTLAAASPVGLALARDGGCAFARPAELAGEAARDLVVRRDAPGTMLALTSTYVRNDGQTPKYRTQVWQTTDDGATFARRGAPLPEDAFPYTLDVAPSDPRRLYVTAVRGAWPTFTAYLFVSRDAGDTWSERAVPPGGSGEELPFIAAVDPASAERVYVRTLGPVGSRLLVTDDAGDAFRLVHRGGTLAGFALSADGATIFAGGPSIGLLTARRGDAALSVRSPLPVTCLAVADDGALWACGDASAGSALASVSTDEGRTFVPRLELTGVRGPLACAPGTSAAACAPGWPAVRDQLLVAASDGGLADGSVRGPDAAPDAGGSAPPPSRGCGCAATETETPGALALALAAALAVVAAVTARSGTRRRSSTRGSSRRA